MACGIDDLQDHAGDRAADAAGFVARLSDVIHFDVRQTQGNQWSQFGSAIALERANAVLVGKGIGNLTFQLLRSCDHQAQAGEVLFFCAAHVSGEKGRGGQQQSRFMLAHQLGDRRRLHRVDVVAGRETAQQRQPECGGETERMEEGERAADVVLRRGCSYGADRLQIGDDVVLAEHDALRFAGAAGRENHRRQLFTTLTRGG